MLLKHLNTPAKAKHQQWVKSGMLFSNSSYIRKVPKEVKTQRLPLHTHLDIVSYNYPVNITECVSVCVCVGSPALGLVLCLGMVVNSVYLRPWSHHQRTQSDREAAGVTSYQDGRLSRSLTCHLIPQHSTSSPPLYRQTAHTHTHVHAHIHAHNSSSSDAVFK